MNVFAVVDEARWHFREVRHGGPTGILVQTETCGMRPLVAIAMRHWLSIEDPEPFPRLPPEHLRTGDPK